MKLNKMASGILLVSLDFELHWGVRDHRTLEDYGKNILGVRKAIPAILALFREYGIHATWATVGFLFFSDRDALLAGCPEKKPAYLRQVLSPYESLGEVGKNEDQDPYHFGKSLIELIRSCPGQEIGTHTFSHYYCLEPGQDEESFRQDLQAAIAAARILGVGIKSLVFPRNQANPAYLKVCQELGICCYRGTEKAWFYADGSKEGESIFARAGRLADSYLNLSGHNTYSLTEAPINGVVNLPSSRFLRPYEHRLSGLEPLRRRRIVEGLKRAAKTKQIYHLWWHPHNFGTNLDENIAFLRSILDCFRELQEQHGMQSLTMAEAAARARQEHG